MVNRQGISCLVENTMQQQHSVVASCLPLLLPLYDVVLEIDECNIWDDLLSGTCKVVTWLEEGMVPPPRAYSRSDIQYVTGGLLLCLRHDRLSGPGVANDDHCGKINFLRRGPRLLAAWAGSFFTIKPDPLIPALRDSPYLLFHRSPDK